jgi:RNA polymerase sigma-70 factor (sigma-E family)
VTGGTGALVARGDAAGTAIEDLYVRYIGRTVALARLISGEPDAAEDLAHEAFLRAAGRFGRLRDPAAFERYLRRTLVNLCRMQWRRRRLERERVEQGRDPVPSSEPEIAERDELWSALLGLPHRQRAAVVLRYYEDLSEERTAEILRCSTRSVNALVSRAMASLRTRLANDHVQEGER